MGWLNDRWEDIKSCGEYIADEVSDAAESVSDFGKDLGEDVGDFFKGCGENIKEGWQATGEIFKMSGENFKEGAWVAGVGNGILGTFSGLGSVINTATGGSLTAASHWIDDQMEVDVDENGNLTMTTDEDANFFGKMMANTIGETAVNLANTEIEIEEAIDEGDIDKANKLGGKIILTEAAVAATAATTVFTLGGGAAALSGAVSSAATTAGTSALTAKILGGAAVAAVDLSAGALALHSKGENYRFTLDCKLDGVTDRSNAYIDMLCRKGYLDASDTETIDQFREITMKHLNSDNQMSDADYRTMVAMYQDKGMLEVSLDFFKDAHREDPELAAIKIPGDEASEEYYEKVIEALAKNDCFEYTADECNREIFKAARVYAYDADIKAGLVTKDQAERLAELEMQLSFEDIDARAYNKQAYSIMAENTGFTNAQRDAYSDYMAAAAVGDITQQEMIDAMYEDPDLNCCFNEKGEFIVPEADRDSQSVEVTNGIEAAVAAGVSSMSVGVNNASVNTKEVTNGIEAAVAAGVSDMSVGVNNASVNTKGITSKQVETVNSWQESYGGGFMDFVSAMNNKILANPYFGKAVAKVEATIMQAFGLQSSIIEQDVRTLSNDELSETLVDNAIMKNVEAEQENNIHETSHDTDESYDTYVPV